MFQSTKHWIDFREIESETLRGMRGSGQHKATLSSPSPPKILETLHGIQTLHQKEEGKASLKSADGNFSLTTSCLVSSAIATSWITSFLISHNHFSFHFIFP